MSETENNSPVVQCLNLKFRRIYTSEQIEKHLDIFAQKIDASFQDILAKDPTAKFLIVGVLNGAFMFTSDVVKRLKTPVAIDFIKTSSYEGTQSKGLLSIDSKINLELFKNAHVLILDDICDTGKTLAQLAKIISGFGTKSIQLGVMVIRPDKAHEIEPEFYALTCSEFIIGCGLDYNQYGRQYPQIYQKIDE